MKEERKGREGKVVVEESIQREREKDTEHDIYACTHTILCSVRYLCSLFFFLFLDYYVRIREY